MSNMMKTFNDIEFTEHPFAPGWKGTLKLSNDYILSVLAGEMLYSNPKTKLKSPNEYNSYEVAIMDDENNSFATKRFYPESNNDVLLYQTKEEINDIIKHLEQLWSLKTNSSSQKRWLQQELLQSSLFQSFI